MQNDEIQEDVTLENDVEEVEETVEDSDTDDSTDAELSEIDREAKEKAEKKWDAIIKRRKAKKAEQTESSNEAPAANLDEELVEITYRNFLGGLGLKSKSVQDEAINLAKKMGMSVTAIQSDEAIMSVLKAKEEVARTNQATSGKGTGGAAVKKKGPEYFASQAKAGKPISEEDIAGKSAMDILKSL